VTETSTSEDATVAVSPSAKLAPPAALNRAETEAIGPSTDTPAANPDNTNGPVLVIMLLLTSGARHPYKIEEKYLKKRNINVDNMDPYNISVYTLKELIWRDWREGMHTHLFFTLHLGWRTNALQTCSRKTLTRRCRMGDPTHVAELNTTDTFWSHARRQIATKG
jgi:hypothetical protein